MGVGLQEALVDRNSPRVPAGQHHHILVPGVMETGGKDTNGRDGVPGRSVEYTHVRMTSRLAPTID